jgi:N-methylhydantoinase A
VPRHLRIEIPERLDADGNAIVPLDETAVARAATALNEAGIAAVAVGFLHASPSALASMGRRSSRR